MDSQRRSSDRKRKINRVNDRFVWMKKIVGDVPLDKFNSMAEKTMRRERMFELEKVKKRRDQRAQEKALREEELSLLEKERIRAEADAYEKKEAEFLLSQCKLRSRIRLNEGRAKPIDVLIAYLEDSYEFNIDPCAVFKGLSVCELESLREDIKMTGECDRETPTHIEYWEALLAICDWELALARRARVIGIHQSVETDVTNDLEGKSYKELVTLESEIVARMQSESEVVEFWEAVLKHLHIYKSKAFIKEIHASKTPRKRLQRLEQPMEDLDNLKLDGSETNQEDRLQETKEKEAGSLSPQLLHADDSEEAIDPEEGKAILQHKRLEVSMREQRFLQEASCLYEKYRRRKPKYFNKVHTGYVWNKYNRIHYDRDNPPPKFVQGYKFNVFYPDLVDKTKTPVYTIERDGDSAETCIIRFHVGPPYEDIAFRIVKKDWEYSPKRGFKCNFEGGILKLYFNFKRLFYRR